MSVSRWFARPRLLTFLGYNLSPGERLWGTSCEQLGQHLRGDSQRIFWHATSLVPQAVQSVADDRSSASRCAG